MCGAEIENMEGASLFAMADAMGLKVMQIRAISNRVGESFEQWCVNEALEALEDGDFSLAAAYAEREEKGFFGMHLRIKLLMEQGDFAAAKELLLEMLRAEEPLHKVSLYAVLCELEICCRETDDFKGAYTYANDKVQLLERMLREF